MELFNERNQVRVVAAGWRRQYGSGSYGADDRGRMVGDELSALDKETATAEDVSEITATNSWVSKYACGECKETSWDIVLIGEEEDYDSSTAYLCRPCLEKAIKLIDDNG
jgi:hypothetical protein